METNVLSECVNMNYTNLTETNVLSQGVNMNYQPDGDKRTV